MRAVLYMHYQHHVLSAFEYGLAIGARGAHRGKVGRQREVEMRIGDKGGLPCVSDDYVVEWRMLLAEAC